MMPPHYRLSALPWSVAPTWAPQEVVLAVCCLNSAKPLPSQGFACAVPSADSSLSFAPSFPPSPAQMCPFLWRSPCVPHPPTLLLLSC